MLQIPIAFSIGVPIEQTLAVWMIAGTRVSGLLIASPFLAAPRFPARIKVGLAFLFTLFMAPLVPAPRAALAVPELSVLLLGEFVIGFLLGFTLQLIFEAGQIAGQICGVQMGYALASVINPDSQADSAVLATFYELILLLLFIQLGVPHWLLRGLGRSFEYLPPGHLS